MFERMDGLRSSSEVRALIAEHYGVEPQVQFAEVSALVDNTVVASA
jgi:hypothetical protein